MLVATYATHCHRLFDLSFWFPGSRVRRRKATFYRDLQSAAAEVEAAGSLDEALEGVSRVLRCPVAVVGGYRADLAMAGEGSLELAQFPHDVVAGVKRPAFAEEIRESEPEIFRWMKQFAVAAIVPLGSGGSGPRLWLLLGEAFSETVYSPTEFRQVERLFCRLGALYADGLSVLRRDLDEARTALRALRERLSGSRLERAALRRYTQRLIVENHKLRLDLDRQPGWSRERDLPLVPAIRSGDSGNEP